ncbi:MAG: phosphate acyltransferase PlsX [Acidimicrobiales bacterium]|nr:phosphate acyltransferase PlsX [Acidimicrobiales bacterium]
MGGDHAPGAIVAGARQALAAGLPVVLIGRSAEVGDTGDVPVVEASEVIAMDADPGASVRRLKDSSMVRCAEAVRDGRAAAMVSAGNTGAAMAAALLRMGRIRGIARPAIAIPIATPGGVPTIMLDAGANADCQPDWLVQFAQMGAVYARLRFGVQHPRIGLLSIGEESSKGNQLVKDTMKLMQLDDAWLAAPDARFIGNVEGRDLMSTDVDVAVADGFTGNVALKSLEGALIGMVKTMELLAAGDQVIIDAAHRLHAELDPENAGGGMLLGVRGVCIISHGSSSPQAVHNAVQLAQDVVLADTVGALTAMAAKASPSNSMGSGED